MVDLHAVRNADVVVDDDVGAELDLAPDLHRCTEEEIVGQGGLVHDPLAIIPGMEERGQLGRAAICCLLHSLSPGGSTWQWIRLLERHAAQGGRATIFAGDGALAEPARDAGIEVVLTTWDENQAFGGAPAEVGKHDVAIVHCEQSVVDALPRTLDICERVALAVHVAPQSVIRELAPPTPMKLRRAVEAAVATPNAIVLVRGETHRRKVARAYGLPPSALKILPTSLDLPSLPFRPATREPREALALTRLAPDKKDIVRVAVELVRTRLDQGHRCRLTIAGDGAWRLQAIALCEQRLPQGAWLMEGAQTDPAARLADCDLVVAQGTTTLEAAALGRRVVVTRPFGARGASATVLTPERYDDAARDPFGNPQVSEDFSRIWDEAGALDELALTDLRRLVERHNSLDAAAQALDEALSGVLT